jgi:hypothetical protein
VTDLLHSLILAAAVMGAFGPTNQSPPAAGPETIHLRATASAQAPATGTLTAPMVVRIERYTPEHARAKMTDGLRYSGYQGFVWALREAPAAGSLEVAGQKFVIRWAHQEPAAAGRTITLVTEKPVFFLGIGRPGAPASAGYEVAVLRLELNGTGGGSGIMAGAARVKPSGTGGVQIDDYAETPVKLTVEAPPSKGGGA